MKMVIDNDEICMKLKSYIWDNVWLLSCNKDNLAWLMFSVPKIKILGSEKLMREFLHIMTTCRYTT